MKKSKKAISVLLAVLMIFGSAAVGMNSDFVSDLAVLASAETSGDYTYTVSNGNATITKYNGTSTNVTIPSTLGNATVATIAGNSFTGNNTITAVTIPATVTIIGGSGSYDDNGAFAGCKNLKNVTIVPGSGLNAGINREAFKNCVSLQSVEIPGNYAYIGDSAFEGCTMLSSLIYNKSSSDSANQSVNSYAFLGCSMLKTVSLPTTLNSIGYRSFEGTAIKNLVIPEGVKIVATGAFANCNSLLSVSLPSTITELHSSGSYDDYGVFVNCKNLQTVTFAPNEDTDAYIGREAFKNCLSLQSVDIPGNYSSIGDSAFEGCTKLSSLKYNKSSNDYANQSIGSYAFLGCSMLKTVSLPTTLNSIGYRSFEGTAIKNLVIPEGVKIVATGAFANCGSLLSVLLPSTITELQSSGSYDDYGVFVNCKNLQTVTFTPNEDTDAYIGREAFKNCLSLQSVDIPGNYSSIGDSAFEGCTKLSSFKYNNSGKIYSNQSIGGYAFYACNTLETVDLPTTLNAIGAFAFHGTAIKNLIIPEGVNSVGTGAFMNCGSLISVSIPSTVTSLAHSGSYDDNGVFANCKKLETVTISPSEDYEGYIGRDAFVNCTSLKSIEIPANYSLVGDCAFYNCSSLETFVYHESDSVYANQTIGDKAFAYCSSLKTAHLSETVGSVGGNAFSGATNNLTICSTSADTYAKTYADANAITFKVCSGAHATPVKTYTLSYNANGGTGAPSFQYGATTYTISSTVPVKEGYTFLGWSKSSSATTASYAAGSTITLTDNTTLYAVWKKNATTTYFLFYDANGGSGAPSYQYNSTTYTISSTVPVRNGYTFLGWSKYSNAINASYVAGDVINLTENTTLYAVWETTPVTTYVLSYNANGGYGAPSAQTGATTYTVSSVVPVRNGYTFLGWSTYSSATTAMYTGGSAIVLGANTTLYAVWKINPTYTCTYCGLKFDNVTAYENHVKSHEEKPVDVTIEGGTIVSGDKTPGSIVTIIAEQIDGKIFKRWIVSGATVTDPYEAETTIIIGEGDVVITADYDECTCGCHQSGISGFFARIVIFFRMLFGSDIVCPCGKYH